MKESKQEKRREEKRKERKWMFKENFIKMKERKEII